MGMPPRHPQSYPLLGAGGGGGATTGLPKAAKNAIFMKTAEHCAGARPRGRLTKASTQSGPENSRSNKGGGHCFTPATPPPLTFLAICGDSGQPANFSAQHLGIPYFEAAS